jgi:uncharacterized protein (TIGR02271 family)
MANRRSQDARTEKSRIIPVVEEQLRVNKQLIDIGSVAVKKNVEEKRAVVSGEIVYDDIRVEHVRVNKPLKTVPPAVRYEGNTMIISVIEEELVVQKRLVLVEEVRITKTKSKRHVEKPVKVRKEKVSVSRKSNRKVL